MVIYEILMKFRWMDGDDLDDHRHNFQQVSDECVFTYTYGDDQLTLIVDPRFEQQQHFPAASWHRVRGIARRNSKIARARAFLDQPTSGIYEVFMKFKPRIPLHSHIDSSPLLVGSGNWRGEKRNVIASTISAS